MTPVDHTLALRRAVVAHLLADTDVTSLVANIYGRRVPANPEWDFVRYGVPDARPFEASGYGGSDSDITLHAFARGADEEPCARLAAAIVDSLSGDVLPLEGGIDLVSLDWRGTQIVEDGDEGTDYHAIIRFSAVTG